ncbi:hypothetical protein ASD25_06845 [Brevundimonas sp. Root1423]|nr:hypothetical protein ASD25_06845 [Brevundimonas sp. Root1423]
MRAASPSIRHEAGNVQDRDRFLAEVRAAATAPADGAFDLLALSGGGANGAYGAGVLVGWTGHGDRPEFEVVTGVSIGALMAPFAFIGPEGDAALRAAFTDGRSDNVMQPRWAMALWGPGIFSARPLRELVAKAVDEELLRRVAEGHREGRRLYIATTSLDTREQVIWDMGALAASGEPGVRDRFIDILTAAASVPGAFPPVAIELLNNGRRVRELHADGRLTANFFIAPESVLRDNLPIRGRDESAPGRIWVIVNGTPEERFSVAPYSGLAVATRSMEALLNSSTRTSLLAAAQFARLNELAFAAMTLGETAADQALAFRQGHMIALFELGQRRARDGQLWSSEGAN